MSQPPKTFAATPDAIQVGEPTVAKDAPSQAPVLITPQEVMFSTAAVMSSRPESVSRRLIDAIRVFGPALKPRPSRGYYPQRSSYLEQSRMSREMDRL